MVQATSGCSSTLGRYFIADLDQIPGIEKAVFHKQCVADSAGPRVQRSLLPQALRLGSLSGMCPSKNYPKGCKYNYAEYLKSVKTFV